MVLYQGRCPFCRASARWLDRRAGSDNLAFLPFDDPLARSFLEQIPEDERERTWHLIERSGARLSGGAAAVAVMESLDHYRSFGSIIRALRLTPVVAVFYLVISSQRARLSRFCSAAAGPRRFP